MKRLKLLSLLLLALVGSGAQAATLTLKVQCQCKGAMARCEALIQNEQVTFKQILSNTLKSELGCSIYTLGTKRFHGTTYEVDESLLSLPSLEMHFNLKDSVERSCRSTALRTQCRFDFFTLLADEQGVPRFAGTPSVRIEGDEATPIKEIAAVAILSKGNFFSGWSVKKDSRILRFVRQ